MFEFRQRTTAKAFVGKPHECDEEIFEKTPTDSSAKYDDRQVGIANPLNEDKHDALEEKKNRERKFVIKILFPSNR